MSARAVSDPLIFAAEDVLAGPVPRVDCHLHTNWTDGRHSVADMHEAGVAQGLTAVLFSEHARKSSGDWFADFAAEVRALPRDACRAFVGVECKVEDEDGNLDCSPEILGICDAVMASVHRFPGETGTIHGTTGGYDKDEAVEIEYRLSCAAMENPAVSILGHPFGMSFRRFGAAPADDLVRDLMARAAAAGVAFEINCRYHPDPWRFLEWCRDAGARVALGSNAHDRGEVGRISRVLAEAARR